MPDPLTIASAIGLGAATGAAYGTSRFVRKHHNYGDPFNFRMWIASVLLSGAIGGALGAMGVPVTFETIGPIFTANIAILYFLDDALKLVFAELGIFQNYAGRTVDVKERERDTRPR